MTEEEVDIEISDLAVTTPKTCGRQLKKPLLNKLTKMDPAELRHVVADMQTKLDQVEDANVDLRVQLANAVEERDILMKNGGSDQHPSKGEGSAVVEAVGDTDMKHIYDQLLYKDSRIMELNQVIMERERRIIDLQEAFSEQGQVARSKQLAVSLLGKRLQELDTPPRERRDMGTATDESGGVGSPRTAASSHSTRGGASTSRTRSPHRNSSPGRAIPQLLRVGGSNGSPPPLDPTAEDGCSSYTTTDTLMATMDAIGGSGVDAAAASFVPTRKKCSAAGRKKVTFFDTDGKPTGQQRHHQHVDGMVRRIGTPPPIDDQLAKSPKTGTAVGDVSADFDELLAENDQLRRIISEMEKQHQEQQQREMTANMTRNIEEPAAVSSVLILKAKAAAQAKIRQLEASLAQNRLSAESEKTELQSSIDQLKESREWALEENGKLLQQLESAKQKCDDLHGELDASLETSSIFRRRLDENAARMDALCTELYQSRAQTQQALDDKNIINAEVERLKDAIFAQDEFISMLEGDLLVYEAHVGILRDSLGATKREDRQHIKTKAFTAKLNALEMEKREIAKRNNDEKLRAKALTVKVRCLEEERDALMARLRGYERQYGIGREQPLQQSQQQLKQSREQTSPAEAVVYTIPPNLEDIISSSVDSNSPSPSPTAITDNLCPPLSVNSVDEQQQIDYAVQELKRDEANKRMQQLELELADSKESVHKFVDSILGKCQVQIPSPLNDILLSSTDDGSTTMDHVANLGTVERLVDELLQSCAMSVEGRAALDAQMDQLKAQAVRTQAEHEAREHQFCDEVDRLHAQLQHCQGQIDVAEHRIDNLTRTEAEMARELGTRQRELSSAMSELDVCREAKHELEQRSVELCAKIDALDSMKLALSIQLQQANTDNATLSTTLSSEQVRLNGLISLLTEIVDRFRFAANNALPSSSAVVDGCGGGGTPLSSASLDDFMRRIEAKTVPAPHAVQQLQMPEMERTENEQQQQHCYDVKVLAGDSTSVSPITATVFTKHVAVQASPTSTMVVNSSAQTLSIDEQKPSLLEREMECQRAAQCETLAAEVAQLQQQLRDARHCAEQHLSAEMAQRCNVEEQLVESGKRVECLERQIEQLERALTVTRAELAQAGLKLEEEHSALQAQLDANDQLMLDICTLRAANEQLLNESIAAAGAVTRQCQAQKQQESASAMADAAAVEESTRNTVCQLLASVDPEFGAPPIEFTQQQQNLMLDAGTQWSIDDDHHFLLAQRQQKDAISDEATTVVADHDDVETTAVVVPTHKQHTHQEQTPPFDHDHADQQQQRQLLLECIHGRQQFEQDIGQNVQQLLTLKQELENSVDVLRAEIWALNDELKKVGLAFQSGSNLCNKYQNFDQRLSQRLHDADAQLSTLKMQNVELLSKLSSSEQKLGALNTAMGSHEQMRVQLELVASQRADQVRAKEADMLRMNETVVDLNANIAQLEAANGSLSAQIHVLTERLERLQTALLESKDLMCSWRTDLNTLRSRQQDFILQTNHCIDASVREVVQVAEAVQQQFKVLAQRRVVPCPFTNKFTKHAREDTTKFAILAARLANKSCDVEALMRENRLLIHTNARLQTELEHYNNNSDENTANVEDDDKESFTRNHEDVVESFSIAKKFEQYNNNDSDAKTIQKYHHDDVIEDLPMAKKMEQYDNDIVEVDNIDDAELNVVGEDDEHNGRLHQSLSSNNITFDLSLTSGGQAKNDAGCVGAVVEQHNHSVAELVMPVMNTIVLEADIFMPTLSSNINNKKPEEVLMAMSGQPQQQQEEVQRRQTKLDDKNHDDDGGGSLLEEADAGWDDWDDGGEPGAVQLGEQKQDKDEEDQQQQSAHQNEQWTDQKKTGNDVPTTAAADQSEDWNWGEEVKEKNGATPASSEKDDDGGDEAEWASWKDGGGTKKDDQQQNDTIGDDVEQEDDLLNTSGRGGVVDDQDANVEHEEWRDWSDEEIGGNCNQQQQEQQTNGPAHGDGGQMLPYACDEQQRHSDDEDEAGWLWNNEQGDNAIDGRPSAADTCDQLEIGVKVKVVPAADARRQQMGGEGESLEEERCSAANKGSEDGQRKQPLASASTEEQRKSIFDNLVDWAWGDK